MWNAPPQSLTWKPIGSESSSRPRVTRASDSGDARSTDASACSVDSDFFTWTWTLAMTLYRVSLKLQVGTRPPAPASALVPIFLFGKGREGGPDDPPARWGARSRRRHRGACQAAP